MTNNRPLAEQLLKPLLKKFSKNLKYKSFLEGVIEKSYAEIVPPEQINTKPRKAWYLPYHRVHTQLKNYIRLLCIIPRSLP